MASSYNPAFYASLAESEDRHFWFKMRNGIIETLARQVLHPMNPGYRILEVGCGTGNVLRCLSKIEPKGLLIGMDLFSEGLDFARKRVDCGLLRADLNKMPFKARFHLIGLFDVVEHLENDVSVLTRLYENLEPGGALLITVPAHLSLWSPVDEQACHKRRYSPAELRDKLRTAGYEIEYQTQFMAGIFPMVWLGRRLAKIRFRPQRTDPSQVRDWMQTELRVRPVLNRLLIGLLTPERYWIKHRRPLPIGTSLIAIARKPATF